MKANYFTTEETLFMKASQWRQGRWIINRGVSSKFVEGTGRWIIHKEAFSKFIGVLNALLSRKDMEFEEKRRTEMFRFVANSSAADRVKAYRDATAEIYKAHKSSRTDTSYTVLFNEHKGK